MKDPNGGVNIPSQYTSKTNPTHVVKEYDYRYDEDNDYFVKGKTYMRQ